MTTRQPLQLLSPPSANIISTRYSQSVIKGANGYAAMDEQEDTQDLGSVGSALSSLENDADDFEKLMIQNARDERRLNAALHGKVQAFRKARTHSHVGLTADNLDRNNARNDAVSGADAHVKFKSPPSSSGSTRSDPAIHAPPGWGRKSRSNRNWMRSIAYDEEQQEQQRTPVAAEDTVLGRDLPHLSVEDSPLSHKSSVHGTPRNDRSAEWDLTFELNEASIIASTPYIPRSTVLDDIRQREIEGLKEQAVTTARLDRIRESSPEETRRPRPSAATTFANNGATSVEQAPSKGSSPQKRLRTRTNSWQSIGKSQPVTGVGKENSSVAVYKGAETLGTVEHDILANAQKSPPRPTRHRREDSQDLLRRLARVSNTPSPGRVVSSRLHSATTRQSNSSSHIEVAETRPELATKKDIPLNETPLTNVLSDNPPNGPDVQSEEHESKELPQDVRNVPALELEQEARDIDVTPMPIPQSMLNLKTPVVTGAWVETPGPRTIHKPISSSRSSSRSHQKNKGRMVESPKKSADHTRDDQLEAATIETLRPKLAQSALEAVVYEAKSSRQQSSADYGDSTINSLEELISPLPEGEADEDTLQGLQLPTGIPRNEAERQRQQELLHLHRMNDRLRAARTSIRDASRGMKRVEDRVEHVEEVVVDGEGVKVVYRDCSCTINGGHEFSLWTWWKALFWQKQIRDSRRTSNSWWKIWGGWTGLGIFTIVFLTWWISEEIACEIFCHPSYARSSRYAFSVQMNAPQYPFVIPTLIYRTFIKAWWLPLYSLISWIWIPLGRLFFGIDEFSTQTLVNGARRAAASTTAESVWIANTQAAEVAEESGWDLRMGDDQLL